MTDTQQLVVMSFGAVVSLAGLWLLFLRKEGAVNRIKVLGQEFELSTPALIVFIVGAGIFILPFFEPLGGPKSMRNEQGASEPAPIPKRPTEEQPITAYDENANVIGSTNRDKPTWLKSNEITGKHLGEDISYYYTFFAGPGVVKVTADGGPSRAVGRAVTVELFDLDAKRLLNINMGYVVRRSEREVERVELARRQQLIMRVLLDPSSTNYMVRVEGAVHIGSTR